MVNIADGSVEGAAAADPNLAKGLSTLEDNLVSEPVAEAHGLSCESPVKPTISTPLQR